MEESKKETKLDPILKAAGENFNAIILTLFALQVGNLLYQYIFRQSSLFIALCLSLLLVLNFLLWKDEAQEKYKQLGFRLVKVSFVLLGVTLVNHLFLHMSNVLANHDIEKANALFRMSYFMNAGILIGSIAFFRKEAVQEMLNAIYEESLLEKLGLKKPKEEEKKEGDVQICIDKDTNKPVIIPYKDRFLHMLILGPTGSGKTSQTLLPMINQDMQNFNAGITVLEPKGDLAEKVYAMALYYGRDVVYFNPLLPNCPYFNPLYGEENDVIENMVTTFKMLSPDSPQFFKDMNETLLRKALQVLKRLYGNKATLIDLNRLLTNSNGLGRKMVIQFSRLQAENEAIAKENMDIADWFLNDYFSDKSKTYEHCSGLRAQVAKLISNKYLRRVLNPPNGENDVDFDKYLAEGKVMAISTAQGKLRDLGRFLGYFMILQFQSAVFRRPGNENTRRAHFLYIDEFQVYANPGFADMLTQGRSYRVASHLATQNRALIGMGSGQEGKDFIELVSTNARNVIIYPGGNAVDAEYYSKQFGEITKKEVQRGISRQKFSLLKGLRPLNYDTESIREVEKKEARFSPSDIIYRPFGEITYCIIRNNSITTPGVGKIQYIPKELNDKLDQMIEELKRHELAFEEEKESTISPNKEIMVEEVEDLVGDVSNDLDDPVIAKNIVADATGKKISPSEFVEWRGKEAVNPDEDFMDDFVISSQDDLSTSKKSQGDLQFAHEEEDELI